MYSHRRIESVLKSRLQQFPVVSINGPRQSGKSTMLQATFGDYQYVSFDDPLLREFFLDDPKGFMHQYQGKTIFDEAQLLPDLFSYIKLIVDKNRQDYGQFILTGSSQFMLLEKISESLAGRVATLSLLPFDYLELPEDCRQKSVYKGCYPELVKRGYQADDPWFSSYLNTYLERDVRSLHNIGNLIDFQRFIRLIAAQAGCTLNMSPIAKQLGVSVPTVKRWLSVLEASYIIFLLPPYFNNLGKRIVKSPKLYFYDTGLLAYLTGVTEQIVFERTPLKGNLFENYQISQLKKHYMHQDTRADLYFLRTQTGEEIDLIIDFGSYRHWFEIKHTASFKSSMLKTIRAALNEGDQGYLLYQGEKRMLASNLTLTGLKEYLLTG